LYVLKSDRTIVNFPRNNCNEFSMKLHSLIEKKKEYLPLFAKLFTITITGHSNKTFM